ncbi:MAG: hypothetical protein CM1200mP30_26710 [Pseudomonadota bacterium]|nr:MAG: hypothetical protein CM1200mP30_26710 [Pseudomonadota bacterium]
MKLWQPHPWNDGYTKLKGEGIDVKYINPQRGCHDLGLGFCLMKDHAPFQTGQDLRLPGCLYERGKRCLRDC